MADFISRQSSFNILHRESMFKVDIFIPELDPFTRSQFTRCPTNGIFQGTGGKGIRCERRGYDTGEAGLVPDGG